MKCFCGPPPCARGIMGSRALWALLFVLKLQENHGNEVHELPRPQAVELETDWELQRISVSWEQRPLTHNLTDQLLFDIEVLRNKKTVHNETIKPNPVLKRQQWNWTSDIPLNCTSHSARVRTRLLNRTSHWNFTRTADGMDVPSHKSLQVFPSTDRVVEVGSSVDYCCIMSEGHTHRTTSHHITYNHTAPAVTRISDRSFAVHLHNLTATKSSGNDLECDSSGGPGVTIFVGYPPSVRNLVCETDLVNLTCHWDLERDTKLYGERRTLYSLNGRNCKDENILKQCMITVALGPGKKNWTLTARNRLGSMELTDRADLRHRVRMQPPLRVTSPEVHAGNSSIEWSWDVEAYKTLPLLCQVQLNHTSTHNYTGRGLHRLVLTHLKPNTYYTLLVRCGTQQNFWKWGDWSSEHSFRTRECRPEAPDVWLQMNGSHTAIIMWKPVSQGHSLDYEVAWKSSRGGQPSSVRTTNHSILLPDLGDGVANVTAFNSAGSSHPSSVWVPEASPGATDRVSGSGGGFSLSWPASVRATCGYIVEWCPAHRQDCRVEWVKVPHPSAWIPPEHFHAGVRYLLSIYACSQGRPHLLARKEGYTKESCEQARLSFFPSQPVQKLEGNPSGSGVQLHWDMVPPESQRGFICGYYIYLNCSSSYEYRANITNPDARDYTMRNVPPGQCTFGVKAYTSAGAGPGAELYYQAPFTESAGWLIFSTLSTMAFFLIFTIIICYQKRNWIKETLFPIIPEPRVPQDLSTSIMFSSQTLDLEKCPYDRVEVLLSNEDSGEVPGEENGWSMCSPDSSSTPLMRCYQQAPSRTPHRCVPQAHPASPSGITYTLLQPPRPPPQPALSSGEDWLQGSGQYQPQGSAENGPQGSAENGPQGSAENGPQGSGQYQPQGSAENGPQGSGQYQPQGSAENGPQGSATAQLPLLVDDGYQPFPSLSTASPGPGGLDTPTSANSFTFLLGGASVSPASANPVRVNRPHPHKNYTNPTYQPIDYTHM